jgi:hypothetical protein
MAVYKSVSTFAASLELRSMTVMMDHGSPWGVFLDVPSEAIEHPLIQ